MRLTINILILLSLSALGGCLSGYHRLALVTSPHIAKLEKEADRYMVMETDVEIEGRLETIKGKWRCSQSAAFNANVGWYMRWQGYPKVAYFAKALPSGKYLIMAVGGIYCSKNQSEFEHSQNVGLLDSASSTLEILSNGQYKKPRDSRIKRSVIRALSSPEKIENTADELKVADQFLEQNPFYAYVIVNVWDETAWEDNPVVKERVTPLTTLTFASDLHYMKAHKKRFAFGDLAYKKAHLVYMRSPVINGKLDLNNIDLIKPGGRVPVYGWTANTKRDSFDFEVCFADHCRKVIHRSGEIDQIYDPKTNRIIQFNWPIRSIGRNLNQLLD
jgi:hypothetical protein